MWTERDIKRLWMATIADLRIKHPEWMASLKKKGYKALVVDKEANYSGQCDYRKKTVCINLHLHRHSDKSQILDTMLHEIAHAVDHSIHGKSSGHGEKWKTISKALGSVPKATSKTAKKVEYKYVMCLHDHDKKVLKYLRGYNRKPSHTPIKRFLAGSYLKGDQENTLGKLIVYEWKDWCVMCDACGFGYFKEDHYD